MIQTSRAWPGHERFGVIKSKSPKRSMRAEPPARLVAPKASTGGPRHSLSSASVREQAPRNRRQEIASPRLYLARPVLLPARAPAHPPGTQGPCKRSGGHVCRPAARTRSMPASAALLVCACGRVCGDSKCDRAAGEAPWQDPPRSPRCMAMRTRQEQWHAIIGYAVASVASSAHSIQQQPRVRSAQDLPAWAQRQGVREPAPPAGKQMASTRLSLVRPPTQRRRRGLANVITARSHIEPDHYIDRHRPKAPSHRWQTCRSAGATVSLPPCVTKPSSTT